MANANPTTKDMRVNGIGHRQPRNQQFVKGVNNDSPKPAVHDSSCLYITFHGGHESRSRNHREITNTDLLDRDILTEVLNGKLLQDTLLL